MKSTLAIISFILGIISLNPLLFWILPPHTAIFSLYSITINPLISLTGLIIGLISIFKIRKNKLEGMVFSIFGVLFSLIGTILTIIVYLRILDSFSSFF